MSCIMRYGGIYRNNFSGIYVDMEVVYKSIDEVIHKLGNDYYHTKTLNMFNIDKFEQLIHENLYTPQLVKGWLESPTQYCYITRNCIHLPSHS